MNFHKLKSGWESYSADKELIEQQFSDEQLRSDRSLLLAAIDYLRDQYDHIDRRPRPGEGEMVMLDIQRPDPRLSSADRELWWRVDQICNPKKYEVQEPRPEIETSMTYYIGD